MLFSCATSCDNVAHRLVTEFDFWSKGLRGRENRVKLIMRVLRYFMIRHISLLYSKEGPDMVLASGSESTSI